METPHQVYFDETDVVFNNNNLKKAFSKKKKDKKDDKNEEWSYDFYQSAAFCISIIILNELNGTQSISFRLLNALPFVLLYLDQVNRLDSSVLMVVD